ncbi:hypothetical protein Tco_0421822 [Tanacetum coccineum]
MVANVVNEERESSQAVVPTLIAQTASTATTTFDLQQQLYLKMKTDLQSQVVDPELWDVLRAKLEKYSASAGPYRTDSFRKRDHDDHQGDDAPPKEEKSAKRKKTSKSSKSASGSSSKQSTKKPASKQQPQQQDWEAWVDTPVVDEDKVIPEDETLELINEFQNIDKRVPTIFDHERMEATLKDMLSNQFKDVEKYAYHLGQSQNYIENQIVWESRIVEVVRITNEQQHVLDFMEQIIMMRENDKPSSFSKADFKNLNKNDIEDMYYICLDKKKEVKMKIFETEFMKKIPLLGSLDLKIMKAYDREITKRLKHREQIRRWESFVNGRPILSTMKRQ